MPNQKIEGWLFDVDELGPEVALWIYTGDGKLLRLTEEFYPPIYVSGDHTRLMKLSIELCRRDLVIGVKWTEKREFWSGETIEALELHIADSSLLPRMRELAASLEPELTFYNCDIPSAQYYLYLKRLFPLCHLTCEADADGNIIEIAALDSPWQADHGLPRLRILKMFGERVRPVNEDSRIWLECASQQLALRLGDGLPAIESFNDFIARHDPDLILSERGDTVLIPALLKLARQTQTTLDLDRDRVVTQRKIVTEGRTYFSYGKIIYKGPSYPMFGRWHIDAGNSFLYRDTGLEGLIELARLSKIPLQRVARVSPGSAMTSMEMDRAVTNGILVPWHKSEPEQPKTALNLLTIDKGGLTFFPLVGAFEQVAEIDFASMYPAIMVRHNISPETVLCSCCQNSVVPEAGYNICEHRRGLIPLTLEPLLELRRHYKQLKKRSATEYERKIYDARQSAIKWMLVSCFGYLGYKNARFGRVEAHEAVTAFGREKLLQAKELAEGDGYRVLHALTDSLWLKRERMTEADLLSLCCKITQATGVEMSLEGIYRWIVFHSSKVKPERPVASRYHGVFADGTVKLRGLACRRTDTPAFIAEVQWQMLSIIARAQTLEERRRCIDEAMSLLNERIRQLEQGEVESNQLVMRRTLTKEIEAYIVDTRTAIAARQLQDLDVIVHPGERVGYIITDAESDDPAARVRIPESESNSGYDRDEYVRLLKLAAAEVIEQ